MYLQYEYVFLVPRNQQVLNVLPGKWSVSIEFSIIHGGFFVCMFLSDSSQGLTSNHNIFTWEK